MGSAYGKIEGTEKCVQGFDTETGNTETTGQAYVRICGIVTLGWIKLGDRNWNDVGRVGTFWKW